MLNPMELRDGDTCPRFNRKIKHVVRASSTFLVYLDEEYSTYWWTDGHGSKCDGFDSVTERVAELESIPVDHLPEIKRRDFRFLVAETMANLLSNADPAAALRVAKIAEAYVRARNDETARRWLLSCGLVGVAAGVVCLSIVYTVMPRGTPVWVGAVPMIVSLGCGAIGASLSLISRVGKLAVDPAAGFRLHCLESVARVAAGVVGGGLAFIAIKAQLVATALVSTPATEWAVVMLFATVAGLSERFVPQLVGQIEGGTGHGSEQPKA